MAEPQRQSGAAAAAVGSCSATDCSHNENRACHAGEITVQIEGGRAVCGTYAPEEPEARP